MQKHPPFAHLLALTLVLAAPAVLPAADTTPDSSGDEQRLRISMHDMDAVIEKRLLDGVQALNALGAELTDRAEQDADSPGYAADWLLWRGMLEELRLVYSWEERGAPHMDPEPPRPTNEALEAHFLIVREREEARRAEERHRAELAEMRATAQAERDVLEAERLANERAREPEPAREVIVWREAWPVYRYPVWGGGVHQPRPVPRPPVTRNPVRRIPEGHDRPVRPFVPPMVRDRDDHAQPTPTPRPPFTRIRVPRD